jgi:hypothetical protein
VVAHVSGNACWHTLRCRRSHLAFGLAAFTQACGQLAVTM